MSTEQGLIVITGNGKGKTTTALGFVMRFLGEGKKVRMIQFLKGGGFSGELFAAEYFADAFVINQFGGSCRFSQDIKDGRLLCQKCGECFRASRDPANGWARKAMNAVWESLPQGFSLFVLDEVAHALRRGLLDTEEVLSFTEKASKDALVVLTGRNMPEIITQRAMAATECFALKHPKEKGIDARRGMEY